MSELTFRPIPRPEDFEQALIRVDQAFTAQGGTNVVAHGEAMFSFIDEEALRQDIALSAYSTLLIPYEADKDEQASYDPAHAFSRGFMMAYPINDIVYDNEYNFDDYFSSLNQWMLAQGAHNIRDSRAQFEANSLLVQKYGEGGIAQVGARGEAVFDKWAESLYSDPSLGRIFKLGGGSLVMSGVIHQRTVNEQLVSTTSFQTRFENELAAIMTQEEEK